MPAFDFFGAAQAQPAPRPLPLANQAAAPRSANPPPPSRAPVGPPRSAAPAAPPPTVRLQSPDEPAERRLALLQMPTPEQLGLGQQNHPVDWAAVHRRLDQLGCSCFQMEHQAAGCKLVCLLPTGKAGQAHRIEVQAADPAEAARLLLQRADDWVARK